MYKYSEKYIVRAVWLLIIFLCYMEGEAKSSYGYDKGNPLVVMCDWDLPPYEFLDDEGRPAGYTIELLDLVLNNLDIPHTFLLKEKALSPSVLKKNHAGLFIVSSLYPKEKDWFLSSNVMHFYKIKLVSRDDAHPIESLDDIKVNKTLTLRLDGRIITPFIKNKFTHTKVEYHAPMEALAGISSGKYDYFIWGEEPLKWKIKELNLENLRLNDIGIAAAEIHVGSYDQELVKAFDDQYARLEQEGEFDILRDKWFHPERHHDNTSPIVLYMAIIFVLLLLLLALVHRLVSRRVKRMTEEHSEQTRLMNMALDMGGYMVSEYNPVQDKFKNIRGQLMNEKKSLAESVDTIHDDDRESFQEKVKELNGNEAHATEFSLRRNSGSKSIPHWQFLNGNCIKEKGDNHHTSYLLVAKDITQNINEQHKNQEQAVKYLKAFEISLIAMAFYDKDGRLQNLNNKMIDIIGNEEENQKFFQETSLFEAPLFKGVLEPGMKEIVHACQHMYYPDIHLDKYLEYRVRPVFNELQEVRFYAVTVRDITVERNLYREQLVTERQLKVTNGEVNRFELQMNYLLSNSGMFIFRSSYEKREIEVSRSLRKVDYVFSYDEYLSGTAVEDIDSANSTFTDPIMKGLPINFIRHFTKSPISGKESWFAISGTPVFGKSQEPIGHFGVIRDMTQLMLSRRELMKETERAQQSSTLKASFLANMTHEIRTPLNAIVGFADLLHMAESPDDRKEFIHIIRHNCDLLLRLIDDILETSDMNEKPQAIMPNDVDFAIVFDEVCQTVAQRVQDPNVSFVKDNPYKTFPARIDTERVQQVITNFVTNAVKYTKEGHIKVGYRNEERLSKGEMTDGVYIYCEDTGAGIPKEKQSSVFERFVKLNDYVQGTGLGLAICKAIADRCNGMIGVTSEGDGKGSTFWFWIPRFLTSSNLTEEK